MAKFVCTKLAKKREGGTREDPTEKSRAVNTGAKHIRAGKTTAELSLLFLRENRVPVIPISLRNRFLALAPVVRYGVSNLAVLSLGCVDR
jgi:hypothetical protein